MSKVVTKTLTIFICKRSCRRIFIAKNTHSIRSLCSFLFFKSNYNDNSNLQNQEEMKLEIGKTLWGVDANPSNWDTVFARIKNEGYKAIECVAAFSFQSDPPLFKQLLKKHDLKLIVQIHTNGGYFKDGAYVYCLNCDKDQHLASLQSQVKEALEMGAMMINVHSGHDSWSLDTAVSYFQAALEIETTFLRDPAFSDVTIVHETHRQRLMYSPFQTRDILQHPQLKELKINADLSHWVCVCERVFDMNDSRDASVILIFCCFIFSQYGSASSLTATAA